MAFSHFEIREKIKDLWEFVFLLACKSNSLSSSFNLFPFGLMFVQCGSRYGKVNTSTVTMWALSSCGEVQLAWSFRYGTSLAYNE